MFIQVILFTFVLNETFFYILVNKVNRKSSCESKFYFLLLLLIKVYYLTPLVLEDGKIHCLCEGSNFSVTEIDSVQQHIFLFPQITSNQSHIL